jgi:hypothetical protein
MKISDVEDYQLDTIVNNTTNGGCEKYGGDDFDDDEEDMQMGGGDQLERLANKYMMKSPAAVAMMRKSQSYSSHGDAKGPQ